MRSRPRLNEGARRYSASKAKATSGTFIRKRSRHEPSASSPAPNKGPTAAAVDMAAPVVPPERPRRFSGTDSRSMAKPFGITAAPTNAWPVRKAINQAKPGAAAAASDRPRKRTSPARKTRALPSWSPRRPPSGWATAIAIRYAETSHAISAWPIPKSRRRSGSATASMVELSGANMPPSETVRMSRV